MEKPRGVSCSLPPFVHCSPSSQVYSFTVPQGTVTACFGQPESERYPLPWVATAKMQGGTQLAEASVAEEQ